MLELNKVTIRLPKSAFWDNKYKEITIKVGGNREPLHDFFLNTRAYFVSQSPITNPIVYHFSQVSCSHPSFKLNPIITVKIEKGKIAKIIERKPFELPLKGGNCHDHP